MTLACVRRPTCEARSAARKASPITYTPPWKYRTTSRGSIPSTVISAVGTPPSSAAVTVTSAGNGCADSNSRSSRRCSLTSLPTGKADCRRMASRVSCCSVLTEDLPWWGWFSGRPVLGERGELELVCRGARVLVGEEQDGIGDPARVGQRFRRDTGACGPVERLDARVDDEQRDLDAVGAQLERGRVADRSHAERSRRPQTTARHCAPCRAAGDLHQSRRPALPECESPAGGQEREGRPGRSRCPRVEAVQVGLGNWAAAEGTAALAAVCGGRVQDELDSTLSSGRLL